PGEHVMSTSNNTQKRRSEHSGNVTLPLCRLQLNAKHTDNQPGRSPGKPRLPCSAIEQGTDTCGPGRPAARDASTHHDDVPAPRPGDCAPSAAESARRVSVRNSMAPTRTNSTSSINAL